jgi:hypothetical protein
LSSIQLSQITRRQNAEDKQLEVPIIQVNDKGELEKDAIPNTQTVTLSYSSKNDRNCGFSASLEIDSTGHQRNMK